jgi:hypothetical protein
LPVPNFSSAERSPPLRAQLLSQLHILPAAYLPCHGILDGVTGTWVRSSLDGDGRLSRPPGNMTAISPRRAARRNY